MKISDELKNFYLPIALVPVIYMTVVNVLGNDIKAALIGALLSFLITVVIVILNLTNIDETNEDK